LEVADIFRGQGPAWRQANAGHVSLEQLKVMSAIENCRTADHTFTHCFLHAPNASEAIAKPAILIVADRPS
jgi:hypothetical protein